MPVNPRVAHAALLLLGIGAAFVIAFLLLVGGCRSSLPAEPAYVETIARGASRDR